MISTRKENERNNTMPTMFAAGRITLDRVQAEISCSVGKKEETEVVRWEKVGDGKRCALKAKRVVNLTLSWYCQKKDPTFIPVTTSLDPP